MPLPLAHDERCPMEDRAHQGHDHGQICQCTAMALACHELGATLRDQLQEFVTFEDKAVTFGFGRSIKDRRNSNEKASLLRRQRELLRASFDQIAPHLQPLRVHSPILVPSRPCLLNRPWTAQQFARQYSCLWPALVEKGLVMIRGQPHGNERSSVAQRDAVHLRGRYGVRSSQGHLAGARASGDRAGEEACPHERAHQRRAALKGAVKGRCGNHRRLGEADANSGAGHQHCPGQLCCGGW
mmetsp:Transcript_113983/g.327510  ORF Transcript_113983/g.327510 Transcript_113983/m.327510 type:complete len:241 (-) Transcript_113983:234-956(-)